MVHWLEEAIRSNGYNISAIFYVCVSKIFGKAENAVSSQNAIL